MQEVQPKCIFGSWILWFLVPLGVDIGSWVRWFGSSSVRTYASHLLVQPTLTIGTHGGMVLEEQGRLLVLMENRMETLKVK